MADIAKLQVVIAADTSDAEAGFARVSSSIGGFAQGAAMALAGAAIASALDVGQFKFSLQAAGAVASTVGFSFDDLADAIAVMGKAGITGSDAGTSLKTKMMKL